jgi:LmbE family N-acetylglucosaminyl deacetylase
LGAQIDLAHADGVEPDHLTVGQGLLRAWHRRARSAPEPRLQYGTERISKKLTIAYVLPESSLRSVHNVATQATTPASYVH